MVQKNNKQNLDYKSLKINVKLLNKKNKAKFLNFKKPDYFYNSIIYFKIISKLISNKFNNYNKDISSKLFNLYFLIKKKNLYNFRYLDGNIKFSLFLILAILYISPSTFIKVIKWKKKTGKTKYMYKRRYLPKSLNFDKKIKIGASWFNIFIKKSKALTFLTKLKAELINIFCYKSKILTFRAKLHELVILNKVQYRVRQKDFISKLIKYFKISFSVLKKVPPYISKNWYIKTYKKRFKQSFK